MTGSSITACTAVSIVSTAIYTSNLFKGAKYQTVEVLRSPNGAAALTTNNPYMVIANNVGVHSLVNPA